MEARGSRLLEFKIPADTRYVALVRRGLRSLAESVGFRREDTADMEVAVSEAVTNSVIHGSPNRESAVIVKCKAADGCMVVEVEDEGGAEYITTDSESCSTASERGRGFLMMRELMDECDNCRTERGFRVTMTKRLR
ncbi:MAG: ATP-binding protein [Armatimonadetes bacterium]|nr:ATP-binding protein [Armatimonadota bacterium]